MTDDHARPASGRGDAAPGDAPAPARRVRVLVAKPGLDGHDVGAKIVCRALMDAGMEVLYTGLRQSPEAIARATLQEGVDVVGLSILSGAHLPLCRKVGEQLRLVGRDDVLWVVGGCIPRQDAPVLEALGVDRVFPTGTPLAALVAFIVEHAGRARPAPGAVGTAAAGPAGGPAA